MQIDYQIYIYDLNQSRLPYAHQTIDILNELDFDKLDNVRLGIIHDIISTIENKIVLDERYKRILDKIKSRL